MGQPPWPGLSRFLPPAPTLLAGCSLDMKVVQEEIFGPVIVVMPFDDEEEGIALMNGTDFGLYDYVFNADSVDAAAPLVERLAGK